MKIDNNLITTIELIQSINLKHEHEYSLSLFHRDNKYLIEISDKYGIEFKNYILNPNIELNYFLNYLFDEIIIDRLNNFDRITYFLNITNHVRLN